MPVNDNLSPEDDTGVGIIMLSSDRPILISLCMKLREYIDMVQFPELDFYRNPPPPPNKTL